MIKIWLGLLHEYPGRQESQVLRIKIKCATFGRIKTTCASFERLKIK